MVVLQCRNYIRASVLLFSDQEQSPPVEELLSSLQVDLLVPYSQLLFFSQAELPDSCLAFGLQAGSTSWYIFSEAEELRQTRTELTALIQVREQHTSHLGYTAILSPSPGK